MGFTDQKLNMKALQHSKGSIADAIEYIEKHSHQYDNDNNDSSNNNNNQFNPFESNSNINKFR